MVRFQGTESYFAPVGDAAQPFLPPPLLTAHPLRSIPSPNAAKTPALRKRIAKVRISTPPDLGERNVFPMMEIAHKSLESGIATMLPTCDLPGTTTRQ
jgi:hypothetical protein